MCTTMLNLCLATLLKSTSRFWCGTWAGWGLSASYSLRVLHFVCPAWLFRLRRPFLRWGEIAVQERLAPFQLLDLVQFAQKRPPDFQPNARFSQSRSRRGVGCEGQPIFARRNYLALQCAFCFPANASLPLRK